MGFIRQNYTTKNLNIAKWREFRKIKICVWHRYPLSLFHTCSNNLWKGSILNNWMIFHRDGKFISRALFEEKFLPFSYFSLIKRKVEKEWTSSHYLLLFLFFFSRWNDSLFWLHIVRHESLSSKLGHKSLVERFFFFIQPKAYFRSLFLDAHLPILTIYLGEHFNEKWSRIMIYWLHRWYGDSKIFISFFFSCVFSFHARDCLYFVVDSEALYYNDKE